MTRFPIFGGCICESVRYKVTAPARCVVHCHCSQCRRSYASLVGTGATIEKGKFEITRGEENLTSFEFPAGVRRQFCGKCGCSILYYDSTLPDTVFYFPSTLDGGMHPGHPAENEHHVHVESRVSWENFEDGLPRHAEGLTGATLENRAT